MLIFWVLLKFFGRDVHRVLSQTPLLPKFKSLVCFVAGTFHRFLWAEIDGLLLLREAFNIRLMWFDMYAPLLFLDSKEFQITVLDEELFITSFSSLCLLSFKWSRLDFKLFEWELLLTFLDTEANLFHRRVVCAITLRFLRARHWILFLIEQGDYVSHITSAVLRLKC